ncbi:unnamed protein product, partial [Ectocarpus sp. 12 AP-2014]
RSARDHVCPATTQQVDNRRRLKTSHPPDRISKLHFSTAVRVAGPENGGIGAASLRAFRKRIVHSSILFVEKKSIFEHRSAVGAVVSHVTDGMQIMHNMKAYEHVYMV